MSNGIEYSFLWFIEKFSYCWHKREESLISPVFTTKELDGTAWTLKLYPKQKEAIYICLCRNEDDGPDMFAMNYNLSILADNGSAHASEELTDDFAKECDGKGWLFTAMETVELEHTLGGVYLPNDILTVRCKLCKGGEGNVDSVASILGRTRIGVEHISFLNEVESFSDAEPVVKQAQIRSRKRKECVILSNLYFLDSIHCEKNIRNTYNEKLALQIKSSVSDHILAKCKVYLLDKSRNKIKIEEFDTRFDVERKDIQIFLLSLSKGEIVLRKSEYLQNDKLTLLCECAFSTGIEFQDIEGIQNEITSTGNNTSANGSNIITKKYSSKFLTDVVLKAKTHSFPAHKIVLSAKSPVFKAMMSSDGKNFYFILVDDLEDDTVQKLLVFLYSDKFEVLQWDTATKLYSAANKYQIEKLTKICSSFLIDNIGISTAPELLLLANNHGDSDLQKIVEDFIWDNDEQVFCSGEWEKLAKDNIELACKTMISNFQRKKVGKLNETFRC